MAVFYSGKLLLDPDGRYISAQSGLPGAFHRLQFQHRGLRRFRMGQVELISEIIVNSEGFSEF